MTATLFLTDNICRTMGDVSIMDDAGFRTPTGYRRIDDADLTDTMEDYLEMIARISQEAEVVRIKDLAARLHVSPSSASRMADQLRERGYVSFSRYGYVTMTEQGRAYGAYLIFRHATVLAFLRALNQCDDVLEEAEKIEHALTVRTVENLGRATEELKKMHPQ